MQVDQSTTCRLHPAALATIIDSHERRKIKSGEKSQSFVIGTLMGTCEGKLITVDDAYLVSHFNDDEKDIIQYDYSHHFLMDSLSRTSNKDARVVGWFSTANSDNFERLDKVISDVYFRPGSFAKMAYNEAEAESEEGRPNKNLFGVNASHKQFKMHRPIFLRVNAELLRKKKKAAAKSLPITAYLPEMFNQQVDEDGQQEFDLIWTQLRTEIGCGPAERTALELMMKTTLPKSELNKNAEKPDDPQLKIEAIGSNLDPLNNMTSSILDKISIVQNYIEEQIKKEDSELDANMGRMLADIFTSVPGLDKEVMDNMLNNELTDLLMVTFLSHLAKIQITVNDKLKQQMGQKTIQKRSYQKTKVET